MKLHHVGIVVQSIERGAQLYQQYFGLHPTSAVVRDDMQKVNVQFFGSEASETSLELIEPLPGDSPARRAMETGGGLNHLCFEVPDLSEIIAEAKTYGVVCVRPPTPATAFGGRRVAFFLYRGVGLVEFVESEKS